MAMIDLILFDAGRSTTSLLIRMALRIIVKTSAIKSVLDI
jgi:hypothetical protein